MRSIAQVISLKKDAKEKIIKFLHLRATICVSGVNSLCNSELLSLYQCANTALRSMLPPW